MSSQAHNLLAFPVMEYYYTIQGEGYNTGKSAFFIRLGGCDVGCVWCDVKDSWESAKHPVMSIDEMLELIKVAGAQRVVITGGEPAMYDLRQLTRLLKASGLELFLETSGAYPITGDWDWICVSPKKFKAPLESSLQLADELKVIVFNNSDFSWGDQHAAKVKAACKLFLQPEYSVQHRMLPGIIEYAKSHPEWRISLQTHKVMQIP